MVQEDAGESRSTRDVRVPSPWLFYLAEWSHHEVVSHLVYIIMSSRQCYAPHLEVASPDFTTQNLLDKVWVLTERPSQTTHVNITITNRLRHAVAVSPSTSGSNHGAGLFKISVGKVETDRQYLPEPS